jgi:hypothetical protein
MPFISSGACSSRTRVSASEMLVATGSANCDHTGMLARTHSARDMRRGSAVSSVMLVASASQSAATWNACSSANRSSADVTTVPVVAMEVAWSVDTFQSIPSPWLRSAAWNWAIIAARAVGSEGSPAAPARLEASTPPWPERRSRSMSRSSSSGDLSSSSAISVTFQRAPCRAIYASR